MGSTFIQICLIFSEIIVFFMIFLRYALKSDKKVFFFFFGKVIEIDFNLKSDVNR